MGTWKKGGFREKGRFPFFQPTRPTWVMAKKYPRSTWGMAEGYPRPTWVVRPGDARGHLPPPGLRGSRRRNTRDPRGSFGLAINTGIYPPPTHVGRSISPLHMKPRSTGVVQQYHHDPRGSRWRNTRNPRGSPEGTHLLLSTKARPTWVKNQQLPRQFPSIY